MYLGEAVVSRAFVCPPQCATVCTVCVATGHGGMEAVCGVLLDILDPAVTKVSNAAWGSRFSMA